MLIESQRKNDKKWYEHLYEESKEFNKRKNDLQMQINKKLEFPEEEQEYPF